MVPGYTLIAPLGSGMAGDVWVAQAAGGIRVALKVVRSLSVLGGRKELKALKTIRGVQHPNLCPLFGFWTKDAQGRLLADGETEELSLDSSSYFAPGSQFGGQSGGDAQPGIAESGPADGTMAIGPLADTPSGPVVGAPQAAKKPKVTAEQLIVVMGLGDCTLYDRLKFVRHEAGIAAQDNDTAYGLSGAETVKYLRAAASAIDLLNQDHDIYHCDIKPQNILIVGGGVQVCDFGLAKRIEEDMHQTQQTFATPAYAAPEVLNNEGYSRQVDQYSLAVTYYELRTGLLPFDITTHASMLVAKETNRLNLSELTPPERKVLQKALRRNPRERYGSCTEFMNALAVAAGIDNPPLPIGKIVAAVCGLLLVAALGLFAWSEFSPETFPFGNTEQSLAEDFTEGNEQLANATGQPLEDSDDKLVFALQKFAKVANDSGVTERAEAARQAFARAAIELLGRIHEEIGRGEPPQPANALNQDDVERIAAMLAWIDAPDPLKDPAVAEQLKRWSGTDDPQLRQQYRRFQSLLHAAMIRWSVWNANVAEIVDTVPNSDDLAGLRAALDEGATVFPSDSYLPPKLAVLLPVLATSAPADLLQLDAAPERWLTPERVADLVRAESSLDNQIDDTPYANTWLRIRQAFTSAAGGLLTEEAGVTNEIIDPTIREQVLSQFPNLRIDQLVSQTRSAIRNGQWQTAETKLGQLDRQPLSLNDHKDVRTILAALLQVRRQPNALRGFEQLLEDSGLEPSRLAQLQLREDIGNYLDHLGQSCLGGPEPSDLAAYEQLAAAQRITTALGISIPSSLYAASAISLLRDHPALIYTRDASAVEEATRLANVLNESDAYSALAAALHIERALADTSVAPAVLSEALSTLKRSQDRRVLSRISPSYADVLQACGAALLQQSAGRQKDELEVASRQSISSLGKERLRSIVDALTAAARQCCDVDDDDLERWRYEGSGEHVQQSRDYLAIAQRLVNDGPIDPPLLFDCETLLLEHAARTATIRSVSPQITRQLAPPEMGSQLSNQVLRAVHSIALKEIEQRSSSQHASEVTKNCLLIPCEQLTRRHDLSRFGPNTGESQKKRTLIGSLVIPTTLKVFYPSLNLSPRHWIPPRAGTESGTDGDSFSQFAACMAVVYSDPMVAELYGNARLQEYHQHLIALCSLAGSQNDLSQQARINFFLRAADSLLALEQVDSVELLDAAKDLEARAAPDAVTEYIRFHAYARQARATDDRSQKRVLLQSAVEASNRAVKGFETIPQPGDLERRHLYIALAHYADLSVSLAFENQIVDRKINILLPALDRIKQALDLHRSDWPTIDEFPILSAYITKGNVTEDLAHYCSRENPEDQETYFQIAIDAFRHAHQQDTVNLKSRYSLGRCLFRYSETLPPEQQSVPLREASAALGKPPASGVVDTQDVTQLNGLAEWYVWKIKVEFQLGNSSDALHACNLSANLILDENVYPKTRESLALAQALVFAANEQRSAATAPVETLLNLQAQGTLDEAAMRLGLLADVAWGGRSTYKDLFSEVVRIVNALPNADSSKTTSFTRYQLTKIATLCFQEQVLLQGQRTSIRRTQTSMKDLSGAIESIDGLLRESGDGPYAQLAALLQKASLAITRNDFPAEFAVTGDLAFFSADIPPSPPAVPDPDFIQRRVRYVIAHAVTILGDAMWDSGAASDQAVADQLTARRKKALESSLGWLLTVVSPNQKAPMEVLVKRGNDVIDRLQKIQNGEIAPVTPR